MAKLGDIAQKVRSKNAGPFSLTIDIFCADAASYEHIKTHLSNGAVARALQTNELKRFDLADLNVIKFSLPRPAIQGDRTDRDMHGASFANILAELELTGGR